MDFIDFNESTIKDLSKLSLDKNLCVYARCGIGDLFILKDFISSHEPPFSSIHIVFAKEPIKKRSQQISGFQNFLGSFCKTLFKDLDNVKFYIDNCSGYFAHTTHSSSFLKTVSPHESDYSSSCVFNKIKISNQKHLFKKNFPELPKNLKPRDFICLNTRFRMNPGDLTNSIINTLKLLCKLNKSLVVIGSNSDVSFESQSLYKLYTKNIPPNLLIDLTTNQLDIDSFLTDALIQSNAFLNFNFGIGGNLVSSIYLNKSTVCLTHERHDFLNACQSHGYSIFFDSKKCHEYLTSLI